MTVQEFNNQSHAIKALPVKTIDDWNAKLNALFDLKLKYYDDLYTEIQRKQQVHDFVVTLGWETGIIICGIIIGVILWRVYARHVCFAKGSRQ